MYEAIYRRLLRLLPADFITTYGEDLKTQFRHKLQSAGNSAAQRLRVVARATLDIIVNSYRLRRSRSQTSQATGVSAFMETLFHNLQIGIRSLRRSPSSTILIVITLALGVGANTSMFSVLNGVLLRPLDYPNGERLYLIEGNWTATNTRHAPHPAGDYRFLRENSRMFEEMAAVWSVRQNMMATSGAEQIETGWTTAPFFDVFGVEPFLGRALQDGDPGGTVLLSYELWQTSFGGDRDVIGTSIQLDTRPATIVGVMPPGFAVRLPPTSGLPTEIDLWRMPDRQWSNGDFWAMELLQGAAFRIVARAVEDTPAGEIDRELDRLAATRREQLTDHAEAGYELEVTSLHRALVAPAKTTIYALFGAVGMVLLIACANVANILLVRARSRGREMAVRTALGSDRRRIMAVVFTESAILAALGAMGGVAIAFWGVDLLRTISPDTLPRVEAIGVDGVVLAFALGVAVLSTFLFGIIPALMGARANPMDALQSSSRSVSRSGGSVSKFIVGAEIALAVVLLVGAGLLLRTMAALEEVRPGFDYENLLTFSVSLPSETYTAPAGTHAFSRDFLNRSVSVPGVESAAFVWPLPLEGQWWRGEYNPSDREGPSTTGNIRVVSDSFFDVVGSHLHEGRTFADGDPREVVIISRSLADREWPDQTALGRVLHAAPWGGVGNDFRVIGVVDNIRYTSLSEAEAPTLYFSMEGWSWSDWEFGVVARTTVDPMSVVTALKHELAEMDATLPLARAVPMTTYVDTHLANNRFMLRLFGVFAALAAVMAAIGVYGVIAHTVSQRTREIGIRLALGARAGSVQGLIIRQALVIVGAGTVAGIAGAAFTGRFIESLLYGVPAADAATYLAITAGVVVIGVLASLVPTRSVARVDPAQTLRTE